ncbi:tRNA pseudouridine(55) synthase TruB [Buchnera aphidicola]|uniref:tRNA pseudouridine(55) synthase TruB n=1 Tax=Buchnera aphidicola TaxID=9 RepID=UPI003464D8E7
MSGILLLDKPLGLSSNQVLQKIKKIFCVNKVGYVGTLDPLATGILPILFGEGTKFSKYLENSIKSYSVIIKLGQTTSTYDSEGIVLEKKKINFTDFEFYKFLNAFKGCINQLPPIYSAVKYKGIQLYKYARKNIIIPRSLRTVYIYKLDCVQRYGNLIELDIMCSKGTYIRTLVHDLGQMLKCGAHVIFLRRLQISLYNINNTITLTKLYQCSQLYFRLKDYNIFSNLLIPLKTIFFALPEVQFFSSIIFKKKNKICFISHKRPGIIRITIKTQKNMFVIGHIGNLGQLIACKILNIE